MVAVLVGLASTSKLKWSHGPVPPKLGHLAITPFHSWLIGACKVCVSQCPKFDLAMNVDQAHVDIFNLSGGHCWLRTYTRHVAVGLRLPLSDRFYTLMLRRITCDRRRHMTFK